MKDHYHSIVKYVLPLGVLNYFEITSEETKGPIPYIAVSERNDHAGEGTLAICLPDHPA